ncbi:hypothetical protein JQ557_27125 [Bradyrhizobium sp. U87765 SZCCT0131]|nr:hypothetical protein [Bradyrhizobium sp. U87765 SZCCT0131]MBR1264375.1 hypothetical protein [Bradyrhizobium sp. U87765 SZCCT0134]MBR1304718.1 hypothetical protein [Bradyrhizobium sp. U87765 SZCCT0110]MBR1322425.1 hypothetical protein [Bradyrhizobium sp. U87765 SZCCT0109]MBR1346647.1 hypothetical protein [Bradyrhizobium sp. U87765 SZCCT0048]
MTNPEGCAKDRLHVGLKRWNAFHDVWSTIDAMIFGEAVFEFQRDRSTSCRSDSAGRRIAFDHDKDDRT